MEPPAGELALFGGEVRRGGGGGRRSRFVFFLCVCLCVCVDVWVCVCGCGRYMRMVGRGTPMEKMPDIYMHTYTHTHTHTHTHLFLDLCNDVLGEQFEVVELFLDTGEEAGLSCVCVYVRGKEG
jgi:hypothetical protein